MEQDFVAADQIRIRESFIEGGYGQPHGEIVVNQLLAAMIASGKFDIPDYPMLIEEAFRLHSILVVRYDREAKREVEGTVDPKPPASETDTNSDPNSEAFDPIPF